MGQMLPRLCKKCGQEHLAEYSHRLKSGNMIYVDDRKRQWKGHVCPDCQASLRKERRKALKTPTEANNPET